MKMHGLLAQVITWTVAAAKEQVELAYFSGEDVDPEGGMGLWQSFQAEFPKVMGSDDYDLLVMAYGTTYKETVKAMTTLKLEKRTTSGVPTDRWSPEGELEDMLEGLNRRG